MARLTEYDERQAAGRLRVPITAYRWAVHARIVPAPDVRAGVWSRAVVEAMDAGVIREALPGHPLSGLDAADDLAKAIGQCNTPGEASAVPAFMVRRLIAVGRLCDLSANPDGSAVHPDQVAEVCAWDGLPAFIAENLPLGPEQSATRLGIRRADWNHVVRLGWIKPYEWREVKFGAWAGGTHDVPIYLAGQVDALVETHPEVDWTAVRKTAAGRPSPLAKLGK